MIDLQKHTQILDSGLLLDHYLVLCKIKSGGELPNSKRVQGFINLLAKKGYIEDGMLTDTGMLLIGDEDITQTQEPVKAEVINFRNWVIELHKKCQEKLKELTGNKQVRAKINTTFYSFLPNATDMEKVLGRVIVLYKLNDYQKIEKCLINHIVRCHNAKSWFPLMKYYISKNGNSDMVTDMENMEEEIKTVKSTQTFI